MGIASLIVGIVGLGTWLIPFFGIPIPIVGLIVGILVLKRTAEHRKKAISGVVLGSIGLALAVSYSIISLFTYNPPDTAAQLEPLSEWVADGVISQDEYVGTDLYGDNLEYQVHWKRDALYIYVAIKARTSGWVAIGFQPALESEKKNDVILGMVRDGETVVYDLIGDISAGVYDEDTDLGGSNSVVEFGGAEEGDYTIIEFKRKLNTGDLYDQPLYEDINTIIWAYGSADDKTSPAEKWGYGAIELVYQGEGIQSED